MNATATRTPTAVEARNALLSASGGIVAVHDHDGVLARLSPDALTTRPPGSSPFRSALERAAPGGFPPTCTPPSAPTRDSPVGAAPAKATGP